jgi:hypothetical protein
MGFEIPWIGGSIYLTHNLKQEGTWYSMGSGQNTIGRGFNIPFLNKGVKYIMHENLPWGQYTMGFKIPYNTGL